MPSDYRWQSNQANYGSSPSTGYYADGRDAYSTPPAWGADRPYYDELPPMRSRNAPPSPMYSQVPPIDPSYRASDDRARSSSWDTRGGVPRSPPRRSWSDGRHVDMTKDEGFVYTKPRFCAVQEPNYVVTRRYDYIRPFDVGYSKEPRGHYPGPPDIRRSIPPVDAYDDRPHFGPGPEIPPYRPNQRFNDTWRNSERAPEGSRLGSSSSRGMVDPAHVAPRRTPSSYERPPELMMNRYPPQEYSNSDRRSPTSSRRGASRSSSLDMADEFGRAVPQRARPPSPRFGSQSSRVEERDEFGRTIPHRPLPPRASPPRPPGASPRAGPSIAAKEEPDEFGRVRRNNVSVKLERPRTPPMPIKTEPSSYPPSPSERSVPRPRLPDPIPSPSSVRHSYNTHSRTPSGSQMRTSHPSSPSILNSAQPKPLHTSPRLPLPTTILPPPIPSIQPVQPVQPIQPVQPVQPVRGGPERIPAAPPSGSPHLTQARDAGATRATLQTPKPVAVEPARPPSSEASVKQIQPETPQIWHEGDAAWRVSIAPTAAVPPVQGSETHNLRWTKNQSPQPNKVSRLSGRSSNVTLNCTSPKQNPSPDAHFGQFRNDASIKLEDVMPSLSRHFGDSNSYNETIDEVLKRNRELVDVSQPGVQAYKQGECWEVRVRMLLFAHNDHQNLPRRKKKT